jgi:hypothetical protein
MPTPFIGRELVLPVAITVIPVAESPAMHVRNALQMIRFIEQLSPVVYHLNPELGRAVRRAEAALVFLENNGPSKCAACHIARAIQSLFEADLDWAVITEVPHAVERLLIALFLVEAN